MQFLSERLNAAKSGRPPEQGREARSRTVARDQRRRLLDAAEQLAAERGCDGVTIERVAKRARVSSVSFYDHFEGVEDLLVAAFDRAVAAARGEVAAAAVAAGWPERLGQGLRALLAAIAAAPERARLCLVEAPRGGPTLRERHEAALDLALPALREGRLLDSAAEDLPETLEEATVAGIAWLLRERLETEGAEGIEELAPRLAEIALGPYMGGAEPPRLALAEGGG